MQWINQTTLENPPPSTGLEATRESYVRAYPQWTNMTYTPELGYFLEKANLNHFPVTVAEARTFMQPNRLFNQEIISDIIMDVQPKTYSPVFTNAEMARYLRFVIIEGALGGIFLKVSPRDYIEGYYDPVIFKMSQQPVYNNGDQTNDILMGINLAPMYPPNNKVTLFTGTDDHKQTRRIAKWLQRDYMTMKRRDYKTVSTLGD